MRLIYLLDTDNNYEYNAYERFCYPKSIYGEKSNEDFIFFVYANSLVSYYDAYDLKFSVGSDMACNDWIDSNEHKVIAVSITDEDFDLLSNQ